MVQEQTGPLAEGDQQLDPNTDIRDIRPSQRRHWLPWARDHASLSRGTAGHKRSRPGDAPALLPRPPVDARVLTHAEPGIQKVLGCTRHFENVKCKNVSESRIAKNSGIAIGDAGVISLETKSSKWMQSCCTRETFWPFLESQKACRVCSKNPRIPSHLWFEPSLFWFVLWRWMRIFTVSTYSAYCCLFIGRWLRKRNERGVGHFDQSNHRYDLPHVVQCTYFCSDVEHAFHCCILFAPCCTAYLFLFWCRAFHCCIILLPGHWFCPITRIYSKKKTRNIYLTDCFYVWLIA